LKPLAIAVMGALAISVLLSLVATPVVYFLLTRYFGIAKPVVAAVIPPSRQETADGQTVHTGAKQST
jgi:hypothetical protein